MKAYTGFDSAWTDNPSKPGAILTIYEDANGSLSSKEPKLATFDQARAEILRVQNEHSFHLVAIDQPTIVPNLSGCRPVERVASSLVCRLKGGVQPANRGKRGMFCDQSAIWRFLGALPHKQDVIGATAGGIGNFILEVYPVFALAAWVPEFLQRRRGPKYNPERKTFLLSDWQLVCRSLAQRAEDYGLKTLRDWMIDAGQRAKPGKADQDCVDGAICALIAVDLTRLGFEGSVVVGDPKSGYIAAPASPETRAILGAAAARHGVPINESSVWR